MIQYKITYNNPDSQEEEPKIKICSKAEMLKFLHITNNQFHNISRAKNKCYKNEHMKHIKIQRIPMVKVVRVPIVLKF
jgi:hypothetical protein